ncbi:hypothetical protein JTE90_021067 [Oedothorax gibbosus]|uniref:Uncharacterized protein n=1 Tax=Oedothorax gibbosus TaxID=931172 RepID=A0AAV6VSJ4_9ARAC|nr:hypothetical protein JTE90_021067 [Oedothorax gibbosus]
MKIKRPNINQQSTKNHKENNRQLAHVMSSRDRTKDNGDFVDSWTKDVTTLQQLGEKRQHWIKGYDNIL